MNSTDNSDGREYFPALTGVRALAAYMVFVTHFNPFHPLLLAGWPHRLAHELHIGVNVFYVLSGFLIHYRYANRQSPQRHNWREYAINRVGRIYPVYFLVLMLTYAVAGWPSGRQLAVQLTLTQGFFPDLYLSGIEQTWTLTVEETFYFAAPLIFLAARFAPLWAVTAALFAAGVAASVALESDFLLRYGILGAIPSFAAGMYLSDRIRKRTEAAPAADAFQTYYSACGFVAVLVGLAMFAAPDGAPWPLITALLYMTLLLVVLPITVATLFFGLLTEKSLLRSLLSSRLAVLLGGSSYAFYLIHLGVIQSAVDALIGGGMLVTFLLLNVIAVVLFVGFERPTTRFFKSIGRRWTGEPIAIRKGVQAVGFVAGAMLLIAAIMFGPWSRQTRSWMLCERGKIASKENRWEEARQSYESAIKMSPSDAEAYLGAARSTQKLEGPQAALAIGKQAAELDPSLGAAWFLVAECATEQNPQQAIEAYQRAIKLGTRVRLSLLHLGQLQLASDLNEAAVEAFESVLQVWPKSLEARLGLAQAFSRMGRVEDAKESLNKAKYYRPDAHAVIDDLEAQLE